MMINTGKRRSGATVIEMAIVGPVALIFILGIMDIGLAIFAYNNITEATREGGRYAQIHGAKYGANATTPPASGPTANDAYVEQVVRSFASVDSTKLTVTSSWPNADNKPNSPVVVQASYSYSPVLLLGISTFSMQTRTTFYINY
jgi:Flp pilus assembly protein TadG